MTKNDVQHLRDVMQRTIAHAPHKAAWIGAVFAHAWHTLVPSGRRFLKQCYFKNNVLFIEVNSAALRHELYCNKAVLMTRLRDAAEKRGVERATLQDIVLL